MVQGVRVAAFLLALIVGRYVAGASMVWIEWGEPVLDPAMMFSPWIALVTAIAGGASYLVAMVWLQARSVWLTAFVSAVVATLLYVPTMISSRKEAPQGVFALSVFVEWFAIGALAHVTAVLASRRFALTALRKAHDLE